MNMEGIFWRDKGVVRFLAVFDTILAIFLFGFYLIGGVFMNAMIVNIPNGPLSKLTLILASTAIWIGVFFINFLQMQSAYNLFIVTYQDTLGPQITVKKSQHWIRTTFLILGLIMVKIVYLATRKNQVFPLVWVLCGVELVVRIVGLYFVRESIDDIKREVYLLRQANATTKSFEPELTKPKHSNIENV